MGIFKKKGSNAASKILANIFSEKSGVNFTFDPKAKTAHVDTEKKIIRFPTFAENVPIDVTDTLLTHECGHLMYSDANWKTILKGRIPDRDVDQVANIWNIIEDIRIEKMLKSRHRSLNGIYNSAYKYLFNDVQLFKAQDANGMVDAVTQSNVNTKDFFTRVNIDAKCGSFVDVKFSPAEQALYDKMQSCITAEDVYELVEEIAEMLPPPQEGGQGGGEGESEEEGEGEGQGQGQGEGQGSGEGQGQGQGSSSQGDSQGNGGGSKQNNGGRASGSGGGGGSENQDQNDQNQNGGGSGDQENEQDQGDGENQDQNSGGDNNQNDSDGSDGEDQNDSQGDGQGDSQDQDQGNDQGDNSNGDDQDGKDQNDSQNGEDHDESEGDQNGKSHQNGGIDFGDGNANTEMDMSGIPRSTTQSSIIQMDYSGFAPNKTASSCYRNVNSSLRDNGSNEILRKCKKFGNNAASIFLSKMKAHQYSRIQTSRTGIIDPKRMWSHEIQDDIFLRNDLFPDGKSHGLTIFVDFTGSMCGESIRYLSIQLLNVISFCESVQIPYTVCTHVGSSRGGQVQNNNICLAGVNACVLVESSMKKTEIKKIKDMLAKTACGHDMFRLDGSTGMASTMLECLDHCKKFKINNKIEILHTIVMTDGGDNNHITDPNSGSGWRRSELMDCSKDQLVLLDGGRVRFNTKGELLNEVDMMAEVYRYYLDSETSYILFHEGWGNPFTGNKKHKHLGGNISYYEKDFGFKRMFTFDLSGNRVNSKTPTATGKYDPNTQEYVNQRKNYRMFIDIFATAIAEGN